jgi:hypothetical protein
VQLLQKQIRNKQLITMLLIKIRSNLREKHAVSVPEKRQDKDKCDLRCSSSKKNFRVWWIEFRRMPAAAGRHSTASRRDRGKRMRWGGEWIGEWEVRVPRRGGLTPHCCSTTTRPPPWDWELESHPRGDAVLGRRKEASAHHPIWPAMPRLSL